MAPRLGRVRVSFPRHAPALLDSLNHLRLQGKFCDVAIHAGGRVFTAHSSVLAAASPFFHDKLLLRAGPRLALPPAVDADAFEGLLELIYCGQLSVASEALPRHLLVASALQMWHVVERCSQILRELEGAGAGRGHDGSSASSPNIRGHDGSLASSQNVHGHNGSLASSPNAHGHDGSLASSRNVHGHDGESASSKNIHGHDGSLASSPNIHGHDGALALSRNVPGHDGASSSWNVCDGHKSIRGLDGSSPSLSSSKVIHGLDGSIHGFDGSLRAVHGHEGSSLSSLWVSHDHEGSPSSLSSRSIHGHKESLSWNMHDGDESFCGLDESVHGLDGSLPSSSSSSWTTRGHEGSSSSLSRIIRARKGSSSLWNVRNGDESMRGLDGSSASALSKAICGHDGSLPSSSSSSRANHSREGSPLSSKASCGHEESPPSSSRTTHGPKGPSHANCSGERSSSSPSSLWTLRGSATAAPRLNRGGEGPSSSSLSLWSSQGTKGAIHGDSGTIHGDINTIHSSNGTIHGDRETIHGDSGTIHGDSETILGDIVTIHGDNDPSSSWATRATTEELLQLHVATTRSPSPPSPSQEILQIRVKDNDDDDNTTQILPDVTTPPDPPTIVYIKPEPDTAVATPDIPAPSSWTPVDLHGNELPRRPGRPAHAPVKLGAAPADGKRFGCACGKRFAARPKRDRHILLTLSLRPFACARCHKRFKLKHHLGEHMKTHRGRDGTGQGSVALRDQYGPVRSRAGAVRDQYGPIWTSAGAVSDQYRAGRGGVEQYGAGLGL